MDAAVRKTVCFGEHPLLAGLSADAVARLTATATTLDVSRGAIVFREGDQSPGVYLVAQGLIKLSLQTDHGRTRVIDLIGVGGSFGEPALFLGQRQLATAEAAMNAELICLGKAAIRNEVRINGQFAERVITGLAGRIYSCKESMRAHMLLSGTRRVIHYLLSLLPDDRACSTVAVTFPARKGVIASRLNLTQEHFSRILRDLAAAALIEVDGAQVHIRDIERLRIYEPA